MRVTDRPIIQRSEDDNGVVVLLGETAVHDVLSLLAAAPWLEEAAHVGQLAQLANHLSYGYDFRTIEDPKAFQDLYRGKMAAEDPDARAYPGSPRLSDYGVPAFERIAVPHLDGRTLRFFAERSGVGFAYEVAIDLDSGKADYAPMEMQ